MKVNIDINQCDFCEMREITLPECLICKKHICKDHGFYIETLSRLWKLKKESKSSNVFPLYSKKEYLCIECKDKQIEFLKIYALQLNNYAVELENQLLEPD